jgi:hypothetical protein
MQLLILEQKDLASSGTLVPLCVAILRAEPRLTRIFTAIGAKGRDFAFLPLSKKENRTTLKVSKTNTCFLFTADLQISKNHIIN